MRASLASRPLTAFPVTSAGRPPHRLFRGLLGVHLITACMLAEPPNGDPFTAECFSPCRCLHEPLRLLPAGTTVRRAGFAPAGGQCLSTAHVDGAPLRRVEAGDTRGSDGTVAKRAYGVYDLTANAGWVSVGVDHDTAEFAVETLRRWWREMGQAAYPAC